MAYAPKAGVSFEVRRIKGFYHPVYGPVDLLYYVLERPGKLKKHIERDSK